MPNFKKNKGYKKDFKFAKNPYQTSKPVKGEIRDASEILGDQPGYNPNTGKILNTGAGGLGFLGGGRLWANYATRTATAIKAAKLKQYTRTITKPTTKAAAPNVTPTGANPRSRIYGEHVSPKGEALGSYQYRSTGFGGGGRVWEPTKKSVGKMQKNLNAPSGYYKSDAKGWPLPSNAASIEKAIKLKTFIKK